MLRMSLSRNKTFWVIELGGYLTELHRAQLDAVFDLNATSGQLAATATGTYKLQYTKAIYWGAGAEIIHFGKCCYQLYILS